MIAFAVNPRIPIPPGLGVEGVIVVPIIEPLIETFKKILSQSKEEDSLILSIVDIFGNTLAISCWLSIHNTLRVWVPDPYSSKYFYYVISRRDIRLAMEAIIDKGLHEGT
jgi:hypothetical protein